MRRLERAQAPLVIAGVVAGTAAGTIDAVSRVGRLTLVPLLMALLTAVFLQVEVGAATRVLRDPRVLAASLVGNFVLAPLLALALGALLLGGSPDLRLGLVILLVTPCTDWYLAFTAVARGDVPIATGLLPVNLVVQLALLPGYIWLLGAGLVPIDLGDLLASVGLVAGIPLLVTIGLRTLLRHEWHQRVLAPHLEPATVVLLVAAVTAMFAWEGAEVLDRPGVLAALLAPLALFFLAAFLLAQVGASVMSLPDPQRVTLTMATMARNSPLALAVAATAFPDRPAIALALVAAPVVELPVLALTAAVLRHRTREPGPS